MKYIIYISLLFIVACASTPKPQDIIHPSYTKTPSGYSFTGTGQYWHGKKAQELAESDMYRKFSRFIGETINVNSELIEKEISGHESIISHTSSISSHAQIELPPDVSIESRCVKIKAGSRKDFYCTCTAHIPNQVLADYLKVKKGRAAADEDRVKKNRQRLTMILDNQGLYGVKDKIDNLAIFTLNPEYKHTHLNHLDLASLYASQLSLSKGVTVSVNGSDIIDLIVALNDKNGCVDEMKATLLLPSGRSIKSQQAYGCNKLNFAMPRPVLPANYSLPVLIEYKGMFLGPLELMIVAKGNKSRLASGLFHPFVEATGESKGDNYSAEVSATSRAASRWHEKLVVIGKRNVPYRKAKKIKEIDGDVYTEIKLMGDL